MGTSPGSGKTSTTDSTQISSSPRGVAAPAVLCWVIFVFITFCPPLLSLRNEAAANSRMALTLLDGSIVQGTLHSFADGVYTINSDTLGTLRIEAAKVNSISSENNQNSSPNGLQAMQKKIVGDAAVMDLVKSLQDDPDFQAVLTDKEILHAITTGDLSSLENNPKIQTLLNKPTMRKIEEKLTK